MARRVSVGDRLQVIEGSGLDSGRIGVVIKVLPRGVRSPGGLGGHGRMSSVAILRDDKGEKFEMFTLQLGEPGRASWRGNPIGKARERLWFPGDVAIGKAHGIGPKGEDMYLAVAVSSGGSYGWDFVTLRGMFPQSFDPDRIGLFEARVGYEHSGQAGYRLFKLRVGGKWSRPLPLNTPLRELPGVK